MFEHYPEYEETCARWQLVCFMLGMGANLLLADFVRVVRHPRSFLFGIVGQVLVIPFLALALSRVLDLEPPITLGLILVAAMPGGTISKVFTYLGRGNASLSISLSAVTTLATIVTVPLTVRVLAAEQVPDLPDMPRGKIVSDVLLFLLAPLAAGMLVRRFWPRHHHAFARWCVRVGFVAVAIMVLGSLGSGRIRPGQHGFVVPLAIVLFCLLGQQINMLPFYVLRLPRADRLAVGIEVTMRNTNLALLLNASLFGSRVELSGGVLFVVLFYAGAALLAGALLALNHRRLWRREHAAGAPLQGP